MHNRLSIRSYSSQSKSHQHNYHQLVLPLHGSIDIEVSLPETTIYKGLVSVGDCIIIKTGEEHRFKANEAARFLVADLEKLPENLLNSQQAKFSVSQALLSFIRYAEIQLESQVSGHIEALSFKLFWALLTEQTFSGRMDARIEKTIKVIQEDLSRTLPLTELAAIACLSTTQFKKIFRENTGCTTQQYIIRLRMEKARALLTHTDLPVQIIAEQVGYQDLSAFSRRFSEFFGQSPRTFRS